MPVVWIHIIIPTHTHTHTCYYTSHRQNKLTRKTIVDTIIITVITITFWIVKITIMTFHLPVCTSSSLELLYY